MSKTNIQNVLLALENPSSDERVEELNIIVGKYLDNIEEPLNMSFWETVRYTYWNFINLAKLCDKKYDVNEDEFVKRIRNIERERLRKSPHVPKRVTPPSVSRSHEPITPKERTDPGDNIETPSSDNNNWHTSTPVRMVTAVITGCIIFYAYKYFSHTEM